MLLGQGSASKSGDDRLAYTAAADNLEASLIGPREYSGVFK